MPGEFEPPKNANNPDDATKKRLELFDAAQNGDYDKVKKLLADGADPYRLVKTKEFGRISIRSIAKYKRKEIKREIYDLLKNPIAGTASRKKYLDLVKSYENYRQIMKLLPKSDAQAWIIRRIRTIHPKADPKGICFGIANMAMQALLAGDIDIHNARLAAISKVPLDQFAEKMQQIKNVKIAAYKKAKSEYDELVAKGQTPDLQKMVDDIVRRDLSPNDYILKDVDAFFDGVVLYQEPEINPLFKNANDPGQLLAAREALKLLQPIPIENIDNFSSIYTLKELKNHFTSLKEILAANKFEHPISLRLSNATHTIMVGYDKSKDGWFLIDVNQFPITQYMSNESILAERVIYALFSKDNAGIATNVFVAKKHEDEAIASLAQWKARKEWQDMHTVTPERVKMKDAEGKKWIDVAYSGGDPETSKKLMTAEKYKKSFEQGKKVSGFRKWLGSKTARLTLSVAATCGIVITAVALAFATGGVGLAVLLPVIAVAAVATTAFSTIGFQVEKYFTRDITPDLPHVTPKPADKTVDLETADIEKILFQQKVKEYFIKNGVDPEKIPLRLDITNANIAQTAFANSSFIIRKSSSQPNIVVLCYKDRTGILNQTAFKWDENTKSFMNGKTSLIDEIRFLNSMNFKPDLQQKPLGSTAGIIGETHNKHVSPHPNPLPPISGTNRLFLPSLPGAPTHTSVDNKTTDTSKQSKTAK